MYNATATPGFPCPQCGHCLIFSLVELISGVSLRCPQCDLELTVNTEDSHETLVALHHLHQQIEKHRAELRAASSGIALPPSSVGEC